jgi:hypothetical protein
MTSTIRHTPDERGRPEKKIMRHEAPDGPTGMQQYNILIGIYFDVKLFGIHLQAVRSPACCRFTTSANTMADYRNTSILTAQDSLYRVRQQREPVRAHTGQHLQLPAMIDSGTHPASIQHASVDS